MTHDPHREVARFYDEVYHRNACGKPQRSAHLVRLARQLGIHPGQALLDVACGAGDWLAIATGNGAIVSGIDISERAIDVCRQRLPGAALHVGPAEPFPSRTGIST